MPVRILSALLFASLSAFAASSETPYDLIRPVWPLTWDSTVFNTFDTTVTTKRNMVPKNRTPAAYSPNSYIPDTLNQAYLDAMNVKVSRIRINQAGYLESDADRQFYYISADGASASFEVVNADGKSFDPQVTGTLAASSASYTAPAWTIIAGTNAATNDQKRYQVSAQVSSGTLMIGHLPTTLPTNQRLRVKVGDEISSTFIVSSRVYSMVRAATLKFYGIARSGNSESWFHGASHTKDGGGPVVTEGADERGSFDESLSGTLAGGWYDCGDHLKESQTGSAAFMTLAVMAATNPDADEDNYAFDQSETNNTDGIPDLLREARQYADFVFKAYKRANGVIDDMALSIGNFGSDHGWWGRPENQDKIPVSVTGRGGPGDRTVRLGELGSNISGQVAAGLAILSKNYAEYDKTFADSCLMIAEQMYDFAKNLAQGNSTYDNGTKKFVNNTKAASWSSAAYNGNNEFYDDMALASVALLYATGKETYLNDALRTKNLVSGQEYSDGAGFFAGGWFVTNDKGFLKNGKNTSWANSYAYALYALYKLILENATQAAAYGLTETERLNAIEDCVANMIYNLGDMSGSGASISLPSGSVGWKNTTVSYDPTWYSMKTDQTWIYNRYQAGNIFEVLAYADVANSIEESGISLPIMSKPDWKVSEMYQLGINQLNYMLGVNPWDVSFLLGVGDHNDAHPHHRAANPEGKNVPGAPYKYNPPVGALFGGVTPTTDWIPSDKSWEDYQLSETCIDGTAIFISSGMLTAAKADLTAAPDVSVEIRYVGMDSAIVTVKTSLRSNVAISYSTNENLSGAQSVETSTPGVTNTLVLNGLSNGTTYYFVATAQNAKSENYTIAYLVDSTKTPFTFTTLNSITSAEIANVKVCNVSADSAEIMWYTPNGSYDSKVYWDTVLTTYDKMQWSTGDTNADISGIPTQFHYVKIGGLKENTTYYFAVASNGSVESKNDEGEPLKFTTPVTQYDFEVRTYQYNWSGMALINLNVFNNEGRAFDSLTIRIYMRGNDSIYDDIAFGMDICQAYDEAGFNKACDTATVTELTQNLRYMRPIKIEDTYDATDGTWQWYFPVNLGSTVIKSSSRLRVDVRINHRSPWPPYLDPMNEDPNKKVYCHTSATNWYHPDNLVPTLKQTSNPGDWSWMPHSKADGDYADYDGMPCVDKDEGDIDFNVAPVNPFVTVYRKDQFVWGYSPSYSEMTTKVADYDIDVTLDAPFDVSDGSYVAIDQTSSTVYVTGHASITEGGFITSIWANGKEISDLASAAVYDVTTDLWMLKIPVKMGIGTNKIDVTIFAGPDPSCRECAENGGCAFVNRNFYVQFSKGDATASSLALTDTTTGNGLLSPAEPGATYFYVTVRDKDKAGTGSIPVTLINARKADTVEITLSETESGVFKSSTIAAVNSSTHGSSQISFFGGDTVIVLYQDPDDEDDASSQSFYAEASYPTPQYALAQDLDCDGTADNLEVVFSTTFDGDVTLDSLWVSFNATASAAGDSFMVRIAEDLTNKSVIDISLDSIQGIPATATPSGYVSAYLKTVKTNDVSTEKADISDGIAPKLLSITLLENPAPRVAQDTLKIAFTEKVSLASLTAWPLSVTDAAGTAIDQSAIKVIGKATTDDNGKSWTYVIEGNDGTIFAAGDSASIKDGFAITDLALNSLADGTCKKTVAIAETPRPVPVSLAEMRDYEGDGIPDEVYLKFTAKLREKDQLDSFVVSWGNPAVIRNFRPETWKETYDTTAHYWYIEQNATDSTVLDSTWTQDTVSIITITIPDSLAYAQGTTYGASNGYGSVTPRLGPEGGFFDKSYSVVDKCPPIILSATLDKVSSIYILHVNLSEPLTIVDTSSVSGLEYLQKKRDGKIYGFSNAERFTNGSTSWTFTYAEDADDEVHVGDYIRLPIGGESVSVARDGAKLYPGDENPWVLVQGDIEDVSFKVTMKTGVASYPASELAYDGTEPLPSDVFRLSYLSDAKETVFASGKDKLQAITPVAYDTANYVHAGPTFDIDVEIPLLLQLDSAGEQAWEATMSFDADIFGNTGSHLISTSYSFSLSDLAAAISSDGKIRLRLEWITHDGIAPFAENDRHIGTGAYISKFSFKAREVATSAPANGKYKKGTTKKQSSDKTKTFGFRRVTGK